MSWPGSREAGVGEALWGGEIGDFHVHLPGPQVTGHLGQWRYRPLGQVAVPLGPHGGFALG